MYDYREIIKRGFADEKELEEFLSIIENDDRISDRNYYNLRHEAIEKFYEN